MAWNDWIYIVADHDPATHRAEEVERAMDDELAAALETRLRGRIDHGVDLRSGQRAEVIRVAADGNRLVITDGDDHGVRGRSPHPGGRERSQLEDLFHTSARAPEVLDDGRVAFRTLREEDLFGGQPWQDEGVDRAAQDVVQEQLVDAFERAVKKVELEHPAERIR